MKLLAIYKRTLPIVWIGIGILIYFSGAQRREWNEILYDVFMAGLIAGVFSTFPLLAASQWQESKNKDWEWAPWWATLLAIGIVGVILFFAYPAVKGIITGEY